MEIKNNQTQIDLLLNSIKEIGEGKLAKSEFESTFNALKEAVDQRNADVDKQFGDMETNLEKKMAGMVDKISGAFEKASYKPVQEQPQYGKNFGEFLSMVKRQAPEIKALSETTGEAGGYLVPEQYMSEILKVELESSVVRSAGARIIPMQSATLKVPAIAYSSNAAGSMYGGIATYWADAGASLTSSQPKFKRISLQPKKLIAYTESDDELVEDSIVSLGGLLQSMFGEVLAFEEDYNFLTGDGVGKPLGVLSAPALVTVSRATTTAIIQTADVVGMLARFRGNLGRAKFLVNQSVLPSLYKLKDENNNYIWTPGMSGSIATGSPGTLYGVPIIVTEKLPAVGTTGDILLADFGHYLIGDRNGLRVEESTHYKFANDQKAWRIIKRVDGQPWLESAITPRAGGSTLSPFVAVT